MAKAVTSAGDTIFTKNWNVYNKILDHNYMFHAEFITAINRVLASRPQLQPLQVLDLGCGDAAFFGKLLSRYPVAEYVGYDSSAPALEIAAASVSGLGVKTRLVNDNLANAVQNENHRYNCIYSSFAIHHLTDEDKLSFFKRAYEQLLAKGGIFIYVDVFRADNQSRADYLNAYMDNMAKNWTALNPEEYALVDDHIRNYDFPIEKTLLIRELSEMGYTVGQQEAGDGVHSMLLLSN